MTRILGKSIEDIESLMDSLKKRCVVSHSFPDAIKNGQPFYHANHKTYIVPTALINRELGCQDEMMPGDIPPMLKELGWTRTTRSVYKNSKRSKAVSCWILKEGV